MLVAWRGHKSPCVCIGVHRKSPNRKNVIPTRTYRKSGVVQLLLRNVVSSDCENLEYIISLPIVLTIQRALQYQIYRIIRSPSASRETRCFIRHRCFLRNNKVHIYHSKGFWTLIAKKMSVRLFFFPSPASDKNPISWSFQVIVTCKFITRRVLWKTTVIICLKKRQIVSPPTDLKLSHHPICHLNVFWNTVIK